MGTHWIRDDSWLRRDGVSRPPYAILNLLEDAAQKLSETGEIHFHNVLWSPVYHT